MYSTYKKEFGDILHELGRDTTQKSGKHELILVIYHEPIRAVSRNRGYTLFPF